MFANPYTLSSEILRASQADLNPLLSRIAQGFEPREPIPTAEFAEKSLLLPREVAEQHGYFQMRYAAHLYGIFSALDDPAVTEITCVNTAQSPVCARHGHDFMGCKSPVHFPGRSHFDTFKKY